ncbi:xylose isomerase [Actinoplanes sp. NPDC049599]|uniref:xylose isomerase n=1 Tax=Actinoplanes sp. NPDC049599 TaxID=3363903 RepID=UPI0037AFC4EC
MRLRHHSGRVVHLSHGTHERVARDLPAVVEHLDAYAAVRDRLAVDTLGVSLWLPPTLAAALAIDGRSRTRLRAELEARGLEVVTLSGVPYAEGGDEDPGICPDWSDPARLEYTLDLARILTDLLPEDAVRGMVTTTGLGPREGWDEAKQKAAARILSKLSGGLAEVAWHTGRAVRVAFQPEPGSVLDDAESIVAAFGRLDRDRLGVSLDLGSLACTWAEPAAALDRLAAAGISIIRVRVAAALEAADPVAAAEALRGYVEPGHPHPVTNPAGAYMADLAQALGDFPPGPWRVRCDVPLHATPEPPLTVTTEVWQVALRHLLTGAHPGTEHLAVESAAGGASADLAYLKSALGELGLSPPAEACAAH